MSPTIFQKHWIPNPNTKTRHFCLKAFCLLEDGNWVSNMYHFSVSDAWFFFWFLVFWVTLNTTHTLTQAQGEYAHLHIVLEGEGFPKTIFTYQGHMYNLGKLQNSRACPYAVYIFIYVIYIGGYSLNRVLGTLGRGGWWKSVVLKVGNPQFDSRV